MTARPAGVVLCLLTGCHGTYQDVTSPACAAGSSDAIRAVLDGEPNVSIPCVTTTYVRAARGDDPEGFFVQAQPNGPGLYVERPFDTLQNDHGFVPEPGDLIGLSVRGRVTLDGDVRREVLALSELRRLGRSPTPVDAFVRDHTGNPELFDSRRDLDFTLGSSSGIIYSPFGTSGEGFLGANFNNLEDQGEPPYVYSVKARLPEEVVHRHGVVGGCWVQIGPTPLWPANGRDAANDRLHFTAWEAHQLEVFQCPNGLVDAEQARDGSVELRIMVKDFGQWTWPLATSRWWHEEVSDPGQFLVDGITATSLTNEGAVLRLEVPGLAVDPALEVKFEGRVEDVNAQAVWTEPD